MKEGFRKRQRAKLINYAIFSIGDNTYANNNYYTLYHRVLYLKPNGWDHASFKEIIRPQNCSFMKRYVKKKRYDLTENGGMFNRDNVKKVSLNAKSKLEKTIQYFN